MKIHTVLKLYTFLSFAILGLIISSCSDDWLDFQPIAAENSSSFYLSQAQAEQAVTAAYGLLCARTIWDRNIPLYLCDVASDDCEAGGDYENEVPEAEVFNRFTVLPSSGLLNETYGILFRGIYFCNLGLEKIPPIIEIDESASPVIINRFLGELHYLRALNYLYLTHIFGEVPYVDHVLTSEEYEQPRSTFRDLFDLMESDLLFAVENLPERSDYGAANIGRATKGAAKALLARTYLFESSYKYYYSGDSRFADLNENWDKVLDYCSEVIESGEYQLVGIDGETYPTWHSPETNGFRYIFSLEGDNSPESVFEVQFIQDDLSYTNTRAGSLVQWVSPRYYSDASGNQAATPFWGLGWPNQVLVDVFDPDDPRLKTTAAQEGDSVEINGGVRVPINFDNCPTGYYQNKYVLSAAQYADVTTGHGWQKSPYNFKLIRYSDVYLMGAEAALMLGDNTTALEYVNKVRERARMCGGAGNLVPAELPSITFQDIVDERRREFACEGRRFWDLVRWNLATQYIGGTETAEGVAIQFESPKNDFMPLPSLEVSLSGGLLQQYPGW